MTASLACRRRPGFTLLEVLVALALLALTAVLAYRATAALVDGESRLAAEAARWRSLDAAFARLEANVRQAQPRAVRVAARTEPAWLAAIERNGSSAIVFTRAGPEFAAEPGPAGQRVGYRLRNGALEIVYWPSLDRPRDEEPRAWRLVDDVAAFRVLHLGAGAEWLSAWPRVGEAELPRAVAVQVTLASGEAIERWIALR